MGDTDTVGEITAQQCRCECKTTSILFTMLVQEWGWSPVRTYTVLYTDTRTHTHLGVYACKYRKHCIFPLVSHRAHMAPTLTTR